MPIANQERLLAIVWRVLECRCEYWVGRERAGGTLRLCRGHELLDERDVMSIDEMLQCAAEWREAFRRSEQEHHAG